jgi:hypothetical protein
MDFFLGLWFIGVDMVMFVGKNCHRQRKSTGPAALPTWIASFCPFAIASGPCHRLNSFFFAFTEAL